MFGKALITESYYISAYRSKCQKFSLENTFILINVCHVEQGEMSVTNLFDCVIDKVHIISVGQNTFFEPIVLLDSKGVIILA